MISKILRHNIIRLEASDVRDKSDGQIEEQVLAISVKVYKMSYNSEIITIYVLKRSSMLEFRVKIKISTSREVNALINWWRFHDLIIKNQFLTEQILKSSISCIKSLPDKFLSLFRT